jgi:hypothetical protein
MGGGVVMVMGWTLCLVDIAKMKMKKINSLDLEVYVHPPSGMIWDDMEGSKPEFGDGTIHFCEVVSSMGGLDLRRDFRFIIFTLYTKKIYCISSMLLLHSISFFCFTSPFCFSISLSISL